MKPISILLVEDDPDYCYLIRQVVNAQEDMTLVGTCAGGHEAVRTARALTPDLVLMDLSLADGLDGAEAARKIRLSTSAKVIILTVSDGPDPVIRASAHAFASAYVCKGQFSLLLPTIRETAAGATPQSHLICSVVLQPLSPAEQIVFQRMLGRAVSLNSSPKTIANQQTSVLHKLGLANRSEFIRVFSAYFPPSSPKFP